MTPYYHDENAGITIYNADCRDILPHLEPVDLVLTDPPYGIGKAEWDDVFPKWSVDLAFSISNTIVFFPGIWNLGKVISLMGKRYRWVFCGRCLNGMNQRGAIGFNNWMPAVLGGERVPKGLDVFDYTLSCGNPIQALHPSSKPLPFVKWLIQRLQKPSVLDPFMGSGTTLVAAKQLGRKAIGIEIEEKYCEIAVERLRQEILPL